MRVAIYARYSTDLQSERSVDDQLVLCREHAQREGWSVVGEYTDRAISGASVVNRPGIQTMMEAAAKGAFDSVLCEALDRLSRDLEDIAGMHKRLRFWGIEIITFAEGRITDLHVGLKGTMSALFLKDLAQKTRRGLVGRLKAGYSTGGRTYGYTTVDAGVLIIVPEEAEIIRRIFREYVEGHSPLAIVADLNRERIPAPRGGQWAASTINGSRKRANGIIGNRLYVGEMVFGRQRNVKDPTTGKCQKRLCPENEWIVQRMPHLAIVEPEVFAAAQARRRKTCQVRLTQRRRPKHIFSGLVHCGGCGSSMIMTNKLRLACSARTNKRTCDNARTIALSEVENRVLRALQKRLLAPDIVAEAVEAYRMERSRLAAEGAKAARQQAREVAEIDRKIARVIDIIESKDRSRDEARVLGGRIAELERARTALLARMPAPIEDETLALHPRAADRYRQKVEQIRVALTKGDEAGRAAVGLVRELIIKIIVMPTRKGEELHLIVEGDLAVMLEQERSANKRSVVMVPPPRIERGTSRSTI